KLEQASQPQYQAPAHPSYQPSNEGLQTPQYTPEQMQQYFGQFTPEQAQMYQMQQAQAQQQQAMMQQQQMYPGADWNYGPPQLQDGTFLDPPNQNDPSYESFLNWSLSKPEQYAQYVRELNRQDLRKE